ncbi:MAG: helix-turn-helix domain-containing protein [Oscillospiraceae bacterium]
MELRLRELRRSHRYTQQQVADFLYVSQSIYSRYECGTIEIPISHAAKLAVLYNVSVDYLCGLTDVSKPYPVKNRLRVFYPRK